MLPSINSLINETSSKDKSEKQRTAPEKPAYSYPANLGHLYHQRTQSIPTGRNSSLPDIQHLVSSATLYPYQSVYYYQQDKPASSKFETLDMKEKRLQKEKEKRDQITDGIARLQKMVPKLNQAKNDLKSKRKSQSDKRNRKPSKNDDTPKRTSKATILLSSAQYIKDLKREIESLKKKLHEYENLGHTLSESQLQGKLKDIETYQGKLDEYERFREDYSNFNSNSNSNSICSLTSSSSPFERQKEDYKQSPKASLPPLSSVPTNKLPSPISSGKSNIHYGQYSLPSPYYPTSQGLTSVYQRLPSQPLHSQSLNSHPTSSHPTSSHPTSSHPTSSHPTSSHPIPSHPIPSHPTSSHPIPSQYQPQYSQTSLNAPLPVQPTYPQRQSSLFPYTTTLNSSYQPPPITLPGVSTYNNQNDSYRKKKSDSNSLSRYKI